MKRICQATLFALYGLLVEFFLLVLVGKYAFFEHAFAFSLMAFSFVVYRIAIEYKRDEFLKENHLRKELRKFWVRQQPESKFSFALIGGIITVLANPELWAQMTLISIWAMGFVSAGLTHLLFERCRSGWNTASAHLDKARKRKLAEVKTQHEIPKSSVTEKSYAGFAAGTN